MMNIEFQCLFGFESILGKAARCFVDSTAFILHSSGNRNKSFKWTNIFSQIFSDNFKHSRVIQIHISDSLIMHKFNRTNWNANVCIFFLCLIPLLWKHSELNELLVSIFFIHNSALAFLETHLLVKQWNVGCMRTYLGCENKLFVRI